PHDGISGQQAGSMGESWSDQDALEYLWEHDAFLKSENPWALGPCVTGNDKTGIRDYALNHDPLNFGDIGFDIPGPEVHADGEIWNGTANSLRRALVDRWNSRYPASDARLQRRCANGVLPPDKCPGNRRWIQDVYDAFLLMQPSVSMLDARDAYLAADLMRYGKSRTKNNQRALWRAFAQRGFGI